MKELLYPHVGINEAGHLTLAGQDAVSLAAAYGTPLYLLDESVVRARCRTYREAMTACFGGASRPYFAGKALSCKAIYRVMAEEGMGTDLVSPGELYTARAAGFPLERTCYHGNNKTDGDIREGIEAGVGLFAVDNEEELDAIDRIAGEMGKVQAVLLRLTPGIDPHTQAKISTGKVDSKFGTAILTGQAEALVGKVLSLTHVALKGFHCHIGSQIFEVQPYLDAVDAMTEFMVQMRRRYGYTAEILNLGGGFGVPYTAGQSPVDIGRNIRRIADRLGAVCRSEQYPYPTVFMEPGRSIVADAGTTLYTVGSVKTIPGYKNYVSVDGGMADNPRYTLYQAPYTVLLANRMNEKEDFVCTLAGRCCESGDILQENVALPRPKRGDVVAVLTTGAYNFSMASGYNRLCRPPLVFIQPEGKTKTAVQRENYVHLTELEQ